MANQAPQAFGRDAQSVFRRFHHLQVKDNVPDAGLVEGILFVIELHDDNALRVGGLRTMAFEACYATSYAKDPLTRAERIAGRIRERGMKTAAELVRFFAEQVADSELVYDSGTKTSEPIVRDPIYTPFYTHTMTL